MSTLKETQDFSSESLLEKVKHEFSTLQPCSQVADSQCYYGSQREPSKYKVEILDSILIEQQFRDSKEYLEFLQQTNPCKTTMRAVLYFEQGWFDDREEDRIQLFWDRLKWFLVEYILKDYREFCDHVNKLLSKEKQESEEKIEYLKYYLSYLDEFFTITKQNV